MRHARKRDSPFSYMSHVAVAVILSRVSVSVSVSISLRLCVCVCLGSSRAAQRARACALGTSREGQPSPAGNNVGAVASLQQRRRACGGQHADASIRPCGGEHALHAADGRGHSNSVSDGSSGHSNSVSDGSSGPTP
jgi:hypothetical protein